jgi:peptide/nickel transport system substrate-binding protein
VIPSAGPYRVASYTPGQGVVLTRNPNYHGGRPHRLERIVLAVGIPSERSIAEVEAGSADYAMNGQLSAADAPRLAARYGAGSPAARKGRQQYFVEPLQGLDFFALNTHRPLFADVLLRRAVNYAVDRAALTHVGSSGADRLPGSPTDHYLPPGVPGYRNARFYQPTPDLPRARQLAKGHEGATAVLYTCNVAPCREHAQILKTNLAAIGLRLDVKTFPTSILFAKAVRPGERFDMTYVPWVAEYPDPAAMLNLLLESGTIIPTFTDPIYRARLAAASRLTGAKRYLTYEKLDADLTRDAAPWIAFGNYSRHELFSARMGCQVYGVYGLDLAALCVKKGSR